MRALFGGRKREKKACKTHVDIIVLMKMIPMKQVGCAIILTWPVHKLLPHCYVDLSQFPS